LNYRSGPAGSLKVELQDAAGKAIPGFTLADSPVLRGDAIEQTVTWSGGSDVSILADQPVRLRFVVTDTDLYAIQFQPSR
jgi:hypothetical protein